MKAYFLVSDSHDGWQNLAQDEYILDHVKSGEIYLYIYINADSVIIGKNQNAWKECNLSAMEKDKVKLVRRISGGGAVFHDIGNVNFSFITSEEIYDVERQLGVILNAMRELGIPAEFTGRNDLTADGKKFSGNAFCGRGIGRQHHGTLLIDTDLTRLSNYLQVSELKIRSKGINSVRSRVCNLKEFNPDLTTENIIEKLKTAFAKEYGEPEMLCFDEKAKEEIASLYEKQASWEWRLGQAPVFDYEQHTRFSWGESQLFLDMRDAVIKKAVFYTDALDTALSEEIPQALLGKRFTGSEIAGALQTIGTDSTNELAEHILREIPS